jgi:hypothetical protein
LDNKDASFGDITSPGSATIVSLVTQILPPSIFVITLLSLNSLRTGPGARPVFPAGIIIGSEAISPPFAGNRTLFFSRIKLSLNGFMFVKINRFCPFDIFV